MVAHISAESFVAAIAGQCDGDRPARELGNEKCGNLRGVGEGLVVDFGQPGNRCLRDGRFDNEFGMFGSKMLRHTTRVVRLVVPVVPKSDRESANGPG